MNKKHINNNILFTPNLKSYAIPERQGTHDVIYSVAPGLDGIIYLGLSNEFLPGSHAMIYAFNPLSKKLTQILDIASLLKINKDSLNVPHSKIHLAMVVGSNGTIYAATHFTAPPVNGKFAPLETYSDADFGYPGSYVVSFNPKTGNCENLGMFSPYEGIKVMTIDKDRELLYGIAYPRTHLYCFNIKTGEKKDLGRIAQENSYGLKCDSRGFVYFSDDLGRICRYHPEQDEIEDTPLVVPYAGWRGGYGNYIRRMVDGSQNEFWGVGTKSQHIFRLNTAEGKYGKIYDYGVVSGNEEFESYPDNKYIISLAWSYDILYIVYMGNEDMPIAELAQFDYKNKKYAKSGFLQSPGHFPVRSVMESAVGKNGKLYLGTYTPLGAPQLAVFTPGEKKEQSRSEKTKKLYAQYLKKITGPKPDAPQVSIALSPFITGGNVYLKGFEFEAFAQTLKRGEKAITVLRQHSSHCIYGATAGKKSCLFKYSPKCKSYYVELPSSHVMPLVVVEHTISKITALAEGPGKFLFLTSSIETKTGYGNLWQYDTAFDEKNIKSGGHALPPRQPYTMDLKNNGLTRLLVFNQGRAADIVWDKEREYVYILLENKNSLIVYNWKTKKIIYTHELPPGKQGRVIKMLDHHRLAGSTKDGIIFIYDLDSNQLEFTKMILPVERGREYLNYISCMVQHPDGCFYGGTAPDGILFKFDPVNLKIIGLGTPCRQGGITALTIGNNGIVYGFTGKEKNIGRLFSYNPADTSTNVLGIPQVDGEPKFWTCYHIGAMETGADGEIYLGEYDTLAHLFIYHPPV